MAHTRSNTTDPSRLKARALRARWVFPVTRPPVAGGVVTLAQGRIAALDSQAPPGLELEDLGHVALLPGLVNAHVHLEFSTLDEPLGTPGMEFADWLRLLVDRFRIQRTDRLAAVQRGLDESCQSGVTLLGEIAQPDWQPAPFEAALLQSVVFLEMIAPEPTRAEAILPAAREHLRRAQPGRRWCAGLSPHAPYTVLPEVLAEAVALSAEHRLPLAIHLAESLAEIEWLRTGRGPLVRVLEERQVPRPASLRLGTRPGDYLRVLSKAHRLLVIHGNYLAGDEIEWLAGHCPHAALVYCPRTHARFGHAPYPLRQMLAAGLTVALGTDSRASAPDLDLLAEMRFAARRHPEVSPETILRMATLFGARALGREEETGAIEPGRRADLCAVGLPEHDAADPYELLFDSPRGVVGRWFQGSALGGSRLRGSLRR